MPAPVRDRSLRPRSPASSSIGTTSGGSLMMRNSPSTLRASLASALVLSFDRALSAISSKRLTSSALTSLRQRSMIELRSRRAYHVSRFVRGCKLRHRLPVRPHAVGARAHARSSAENSRDRAAISKLAASRFTSHSNGPGVRLVEVVDVEHERAVGRREPTEVREVGVAAALDAQARVAAWSRDRTP